MSTDFRRAIRLIALKPADWDAYDNISEPDLPGCFIASVVNNPLVLADSFIHEFQHNRLSFIEESEPLFASTRSVGGTSFYSPWRDKPRALLGVFHGLYVFIAVCRYWLEVYKADTVEPMHRSYRIDRLLRLPRQLTLASGILRRHAPLTSFGKALGEQMSQDAAILREQVSLVGLPADAPALIVTADGAYEHELSKIDGRPLTACGAVREHLKLYDQRQHAAGLLDDAAFGVAA